MTRLEEAIRAAEALTLKQRKREALIMAGTVTIVCTSIASGCIVGAFIVDGLLLKGFYLYVAWCASVPMRHAWTKTYKPSVWSRPESSETTMHYSGWSEWVLACKNLGYSVHVEKGKASARKEDKVVGEYRKLLFKWRRPAGWLTRRH